MSDAPSAGHRNLFLGLSVVLVVLGALSALDVGNQTYTGFQTDGNNKVTEVDAGGPAATGGLQVGDVIASVNGIAVTDTKGAMNQARPDVGASWPYVVQRGGQSLTLPIVQGALPPKYRYVSRAATLLGLCFLGFTLWAYFGAPSAATAILAWFGLAFGLGFLGVPYFSAAWLRNLLGSVVTVIILFGCAALVKFLLVFPTRRPFLDRSSAGRIVYGPAVVLGVLLLLFTVLQPASSSVVNVLFRTLFALVFGGYFLTGIVLLFRRYAGAVPADRAAHGLGLMLAGVIIGLGPLLLAQVLTLVAPSVVLPQSQFYFLTLALIPVTFAVAATRSARATATA